MSVSRSAVAAVCAVIFFIAIPAAAFETHFYRGESAGPAGANAVAFSAGDVNGDSRTDFVVANEAGSEVVVFLASVEGTLEISQRFTVGEHPFLVATPDLDGDGSAEIVVAFRDRALVEVFRNTGGSFRTFGTFPTPVVPRKLASGDVNGDRRQDVVLAGGPDTFAVLPARGDGGLLPAITGSTSSMTPHQIAAGDLNRDGNIDLAVAHQSRPELSLIFGNGNGTFRPPIVHDTEYFANEVVIADLDGDFRMDVVLPATGRNLVVFLFGDASGNFPQRFHFETSAEAVSVKSADVNADELPDLFVVTSDGRITLHEGTGNGTFTRNVVFAADAAGEYGGLHLGELNLDSRIDAVALAVKSEQLVPFINVSGESEVRISTSVNPVPAGQPLSLSVTAAPVSHPGPSLPPTLPVPTGTITITERGKLLAAGNLVNGLFRVDVPLSAGLHDLTVTYDGDTSYVASTANVTVTVLRGSTQTRISASATQLVFGTPLNLVATVSGEANPTGTVAFTSNSTLLGRVALSEGQASFSTVLEPGVHTIVGQYSGDARNEQSQSAPIVVMVTKAQPQATLVACASSCGTGIVARPGERVTLTANLTGGSHVPSGSVTFFEGNTPLETLSLQRGSAVLQLPDGVTEGVHRYRFTYSGDSRFAGASAEAFVTRGTANIPSADQSTVTLSRTALPADGASTTRVTVRVRDAAGRDLSGSSIFVTITASRGVAGNVTLQPDGSYAADLRAPSAPGTATITVSVNGVVLTTKPVVTFTSGRMRGVRK